MPTLYELTADVQELERLFTEIEEARETTDWERIRLSENLLSYYLMVDDAEEQLAEKIDAYVSVYRTYQARAQAQKAEAKHLADMAKANENRMESLKEAVKYASEQLGRSKLQGNSRSITVSTLERPAIEIVDDSLIPAEYVEIVTQRKVDKKAIADHLVATGEIVDGVEIRKVTQVRFN